MNSRPAGDNADMARSILKPHATLFAAILRASDPAVTVASGLIAYVAYLGALPPPEHYQIFLAVVTLVVVAVFPLFRLYEAQRGVSIAEEFRQLLLAWFLVAAIAGTAIFLTKIGDAFSRVWVVASLGGGLVLTAAVRISIRVALRSLRRHGHNLRHVAIVGAGALGRTIGERLREASWTGFNVVSFYDDATTMLGTKVAGIPVRNTADMLATDIDAGGIDQVWIALPLRAELRIREILSALREYPIEVRFVPDIYSFHLLNHSITEVAGLPVMSLTETPMSGPNWIIKVIEDYLLALLLLAVLAPVLALIAIGVKLSSPGPVLYRQERVTWNGEHFCMLKFRTMPTDTEGITGPVWARHGEGRTTPFGTLLRRWSLDELPQLLNVLRGEMSLVGPRPERPEFVARFRREIPGYMQKHLVKAGITGWAQVNDLRGDSDLRERIAYDLFYIEHWSVWFDLRILALTLAHLVWSRNAR